MQDSIESGFLRKLCFECEQHLKINLAQTSVMHNSCSGLLRMVTLLFLFMTKAATAHVFDWIFVIASLIVWSQFPLLPDTFRDAALQCFVIAQMFPWWWSVTSQAPECVSSNVSRQRSKVEGDRLTDSTSSKIILWSLGCSVWTAKSKHSCLPVCHSFLLSDY